MKKEFSFYTGLEYPNALIFGVLFIGISIYGISHIFNNLNENLTPLLIQLVFLSVTILIGLLSLSYNSIKINLTTNEIKIATHYFLLFPSIETYDLSRITKIRVKQIKNNYSAGGGFLTTAKSSFSVKETNMLFYSSDKKTYFTVERLSNQNKLKLTQFFSQNLRIECIED